MQDIKAENKACHIFLGALWSSFVIFLPQDNFIKILQNYSNRFLKVDYNTAIVLVSEQFLKIRR